MKNELKALYRKDKKLALEVAKVMGYKIKSKKRSLFPEKSEVEFENALKKKEVGLKKNLGKGIFLIYTGGEKAIKIKVLGYE